MQPEYRAEKEASEDAGKSHNGFFDDKIKPPRSGGPKPQPGVGVAVWKGGAAA